MRPAALIPVSLSLSLLVSGRLHHSRVPEDPYAFPKYRVSFLNGLPVLNDTAERWLHDGLRGGEHEFLDQPWQDSQWHATEPRSIEGSDNRPTSDDTASSQDTNYTLQQMKLGPKSNYLCLIPRPPIELPVVEEAPTEVATPVHSWSLLQPLSGSCLYHRQGWFTYSYCHNSHVRQFHELHHQQIPSTGEYKPEEDPEWEAYTLGRAPPTLETGAELSTAEAAAAANLELARGAGSRYLVQRWGDGTFCDKMDRKREIEIQFHCSMTMTDTILFVKETQTCHYVLHIATPRLCGEPGFKSRIDAEEEQYIRCREVLNPTEFERVDRSLPPAAYPFKRPKPLKKVIAPPPSPPPESKKDDAGAKKGAEPVDMHSEVLRKALQRLLARRQEAAGDSHVVVEQLPDGEGELLIEFVDIELPEGEEADLDDLFLAADGQAEGRLYDILRAAGHDVRGPKGDKGDKGGNKAKLGRQGSHADADADVDAEEEEEEEEEEEGDGGGEAEEGRAKKHRDEL